MATGKNISIALSMSAAALAMAGCSNPCDFYIDPLNPSKKIVYTTIEDSEEVKELKEKQRLADEERIRNMPPEKRAKFEAQKAEYQAASKKNAEIRAEYEKSPAYRLSTHRVSTGECVAYYASQGFANLIIFLIGFYMVNSIIRYQTGKSLIFRLNGFFRK